VSHSRHNPRAEKLDFPATARNDPRPGDDADNPLGLTLADDQTNSTEPIATSARGPGQGDGPPGPKAPAAADPPPDPEPAHDPDLNPFDPARLRLSQDFRAAVGVRKVIVSIPVKKPISEWFVRAHPDQAYRIETAVLELKEDREMYLVAPELWEALATEPTFSPRLLTLSINRQGVAFLWPIRLPGPDGKLDSWNLSAHEACRMAEAEWIRVKSNQSLQGYDVEVASAALSEPSWPTMPFSEILRIAFRDRYISALDHPVLRRLRGEV
jgi:hypothetical protein